MKIANEYNHLHAQEFLIVRRQVEYTEIKNAIARVNANQFLKLSCDLARLGTVLYNQGQINTALKQQLQPYGWKERRVDYYVTGDEQTARDILPIYSGQEQKEIIESRGFQSYPTFNQVDFQKGEIALEIQFGKYFSVAYDLHVKHTFFYSRNDIEVGIEVIPTKAMEEHMDTGVPWFENEMANVIREGRMNPPVPILILGIEPEVFWSCDPMDYADTALIQIIQNSDVGKLKSQIAKKKCQKRVSPVVQARIEKIERCFSLMETRA